jgi:hypothetical protein
LNSEEKQETVSLTPDEVSTLAEYQRAIGDIQQQMQGAYRLISRQHKLTGQWNLSPDGLALVKVA